MLKNLLQGVIILVFSAGLLSAKEKAVTFKKFRQADIGNPALAGKSEKQDNGILIVAGGADVWGVRDEFHFAFIEHNGDFDFACRVASLSSPHLYTKAGLMVREELSENSRHIFFQVFPDNKARNKNNGGYEFQYRLQKGGEMKAIYPPKADGIPGFPVNYPDTWIRLERKGNEFRGFWSSDGKTWKLYTTFTLELPDKIFLGLAVTSHNKKESATAVFKDISTKKPALK